MATCLSQWQQLGDVQQPAVGGERQEPPQHPGYSGHNQATFPQCLLQQGSVPQHCSRPLSPGNDGFCQYRGLCQASLAGLLLDAPTTGCHWPWHVQRFMPGCWFLGRQCGHVASALKPLSKDAFEHSTGSWASCQGPARDPLLGPSRPKGPRRGSLDRPWWDVWLLLLQLPLWLTPISLCSPPTSTWVWVSGSTRVIDRCQGQARGLQEHHQS